MSDPRAFFPEGDLERLRLRIIGVLDRRGDLRRRDLQNWSNARYSNADLFAAALTTLLDEEVVAWTDLGTIVLLKDIRDPKTVATAVPEWDRSGRTMRRGE